MPEVIIYTADYCGYCTAAKRFFEQQKQVTYREVDVTRDHEKRRWLAETTGQMTVPQIWIGDQHVGGYTDLRALDAAGQLDPLLLKQE